MTDHAQQHRFATASEVAEYLRISRKTFRRHVEPHLRGIDIGTRTIYDWEEAEGWLEASKGGPSTGHPNMKPLETRAIRGHAVPKTGTFGPYWDQTGPGWDQSKESER